MAKCCELAGKLYFCGTIELFWFAIHDQMARYDESGKIVIMDKIINLHVKLVPAIDFEIRIPHDAYTVYCRIDGAASLASGWTLKDAINLFRKQHHVDNQTRIRLIRPFRKQRHYAIFTDII